MRGYTTRTVHFEKVSINPRRSGKCAACGKPCTRSKEFYQTISQFNTNADGTRKTYLDIRSELVEEQREWLKTPLYHAKCEPRK